jgi:hypothetical protein
MNKNKCPQCENGRVTFEEDGRRVEDACYHCCATGFINDATLLNDRITAAAYQIAHKTIARRRKEYDADAEANGGEGWDFIAAECGVSAYDYTRAKVDEEAEAIGRRLSGLASDVHLLALLDILVPEPEKTPTVSPVRLEPPGPAGDIPF